MNRVLLAFLGVLLLAAGGFAVATHYGVLTVLGRDARLAPGAALPPTWVLYVTAAAGVVVALLALRWLLAQLTPATSSQTWQLADGPDRTELATGTATAPFVAEVTDCPGVHAARAALSGPHRAPRLAVVVHIEQDAEVPAVRDHLTSVALPRLRQALDLDALPTTVEFRFTNKTGARVR